MLISRGRVPAIGLLAVALLCGCAAASGPNAPPLDIRGRYSVVWYIGYNPPDAGEVATDPSLPRGECRGSIDISEQTDRSVKGTIVVPEGAQPPCQAASFELRGTLSRVYFENVEGVVDYGWDLAVTSDIEPLLGCSFVSEARGNSPSQNHGVGRIDPARGIRLAFGAVYACPSGRWWIVAGADGRGSR